MFSRRPISLLLECTLLRGLEEPTYDVHKIGRDPYVLYKCKVSVGEYTAIGTGYTERESMQNAARCILKRHSEKEVPIDKLKPYRMRVESSSQKTTVKDLDDLCWIRGLGAPEYRLLTSQHRHITCVCTVSGVKSSGKGYTLELAKLNAADKMLTRLRSSVHLNGTPLYDEESDSTICADEYSTNESGTASFIDTD